MLSGPQRTSQRRCDYVKQKNQQNVAANKFISNSIQFDERKIGRRCVRVIKMLHRLWIGMRRNVDGQTDFRDACIWYDINGLHSQWRQKGSGGKRKNQVKCPECQFTILELRDEFVCMWIRGSCRNVAGRNKAFVQCENFVFTILLIVSMHSKCDSFNHTDVLSRRYGANENLGYEAGGFVCPFWQNIFDIFDGCGDAKTSKLNNNFLVL